MLQTMRDNAQGIIAKIIVGFIIIVFALFGVESIVSLGGGEEAAAKVGDLEISELEISRAVEQQKASLRRQFGEQFDENLFSEELLRSSAIDQLIRQNVAIAQADAMGLYASAEQIDEMILTIPAFQLDGKFSKEQFRNILRLNGWTPLSFRESLAQDIKVNQVQLAMSLSEYPSDYSVRLNQMMAQEKRSFSYAEIPFEGLLASVEVSDNDIQTYYDDNSERFKSPETVSVKYVALSRQNLADQVDVLDEDIEAAYADYVDGLAAKEERKASHILIEVNDDRSEEAALATIKEMADKLAAGEDFAALAAESDDIGTQNTGGDLGFVGRDVFDPAFESALYALEQDQVSEPVRSEFGYHLIKLTEVRGEQPQPLEQYRSTLESEVRNGKAAALLAEQIQELSNIAFSASSLEEVADAFGLKIETSAPFTRTGGAGLAESGSVRNAVFAENVLLDGELSEVVEVDDTAYVMAVSEHKVSEVLPLEAVRAGIETALRQEKAAEQARTTAMAVAKGEQTLGEATEWKEAEVSYADNGDVPRSVKAKAFAMKADEADIVDVPGGVAIVKMAAISVPELSAVELSEDQRGQLAALNGRSQLTSYAKWAEEITEVERPASAEVN